MIGKIKKGSGFKGCVNYVLGKEQAALLHAEGVLAESKQDIIRSFCMQTEMNPGLKKPVGHIALSYSVVDAPKLTDEKMVQLAQEYMREMKITDTQYIIVRHQDREHPHVHIVFNRIDNNGKTISDSNDMYRNEQVCKKLKEKHELYFAKGKEQVKQHRLNEPDKTKYEIFHALRDAVPRCRDWPELTAALRHEGIATEFRMRGGTSDVQGVVFARNGYPFNGSKIDRQFSFSKIDHALSLNRRQALSANERGSVSNPVASFSHLLEDLLQPVYDADEERRLQERLRKKRKQHRL